MSESKPWWHAVLAWVSIVAVGLAIHGLGYWQGRHAGYDNGVKVMMPAAIEACTISTIATLRNATRLLEEKNRQADLAMQRSTRP